MKNDIADVKNDIADVKDSIHALNDSVAQDLEMLENSVVERLKCPGSVLINRKCPGMARIVVTNFNKT